MNRNVSRSTKRRGLVAHTLSYVLVNPVLVLVWWLATPEVFFWPAISLVGWGIGLLAHALAYRAAKPS